MPKQPLQTSHSPAKKSVTKNNASDLPHNRIQPAILQLQRTIGNRAVLHMFGGGIQRMPTRNTIIATLGNPHKDVKLFGFVGPTLKENSTKYKHVLDEVDAYHAYVTNTNAGKTRGEVMDRLAEVLRRMDRVINACDAYQGEEGEKAEYFLRMKIQVQNEKTSAITDMMTYANQVSTVSQHVRNQTRISGILRTQPGPLDTNEGDFVGTVGGGINQLAKYESNNQTSYFKKNVNQITAPEGLDESDPMTTAYYTATDAGIDLNNVRSANRDVATYRLDQLLSANVIARTQFALRTVGGETTMGSLMQGAGGSRAGDLGKAGRITNQAQHANNEISTQDPNLMRQLSKLQLLDALAGQIDRNEGNYFIEFDNRGNVLRVTGIDNDASFGTRNEVGNIYREYPGFSKYVDKEMATAILTIPDELFRLILSDLLTNEEIGAFMKRLNKLKLLLVAQSTQLLEPNQWDQAVQKGLLQEQKSFTARIGQAGWDGH